MARSKKVIAEPMPTIWRVPDALWEQFVLPVLRELDPEPHTGRPRIDQRKALDGIIYQMRSGCQWNHLPPEFGDDASIHRTFQRWIKGGVLDRICGKLIEFCDELKGVKWDWQSADASMGKARFGGMMWDPTPRIERKTARNEAFSSMAMAVRWACSSPPPT